MTNDPLFITQVELASRWRISEATLERDRSLKKGVRYMKIGGLIRYRLDDVLAYEESRMRETAPQYTGGQPPYGYTLTAGQLVKHEGEQAVLALVRTYRERGLSLRAIANVLAEQGIRSRTGKHFLAAIRAMAE